jgi:tetratricopeptide (TPR) repeat protein
LNIRRTLAEQDQTNAGWQRDLAVCYDNVGAILEAQGELQGALEACQQSLNIRRTLAEQDQTNAGWQRDLAVSYDNVGAILEARGKLEGALEACQQSLNIRRTLAEQNKTSPGWQRDLAVSYEKVGDLLLAQGKLDEGGDGAISDYTKAIELDPDYTDAYFGRASAKQRIADFQGAIRDFHRYIELSPRRQSIQDYPHLFVWLLRVRQGETSEANDELSAYLNEGRDRAPGDWVSKIGELLLDKISEADFLARASSSGEEKDPGRLCEAWYYLGMKHLLTGDKKTAGTYFSKCLGTQQTNVTEYDLAQAELKALAATR